MGRHESEQNGAYQPSTTLLKANNISMNSYAPFRGNIFNIIFFVAGVVYFLSLLMKKIPHRSMADS